MTVTLEIRKTKVVANRGIYSCIIENLYMVELQIQLL